MHSGIILDAAGYAYDLAALMGGGTPVSTGTIAAYAPRSGLIVDKDGVVRDVVALLGGGTPLSDYGQADMAQYAPKSGIILGADGSAYDLAALLGSFAGGAPAHALVKQTAVYASDQAPWSSYPGFAYLFTRAYIGTATRASVYVCVSEPCALALQIMSPTYYVLERRTYAAAGNGWHAIDIPADAGDSFYISFCASVGAAIVGLSSSPDADWAGGIRATSTATPGEYSWWETGSDAAIFPLIKFEE